MASEKTQAVAFTAMRGRNSVVQAAPVSGGAPLDIAAEAINVRFDGVRFAVKREGGTALSLTHSSGGPFSGYFRAFHRGPTGILYAVDSTGQISYLAVGATQWVEFAVSDAMTTPTTAAIRFVNGRGGLVYLAYPNAAGRMHVIDGTSIRRTGMGTPAAPTVANTGGGAYANTPRYYRVRMLFQSASVTLRKGEAGASVSFTPSGAGTAARVTKPTTIEDATHWQVEVSLDDAVWYVLSAAIAVGTTTYDDSAATTTYSTNDAAPLAGRYTNWTAVSLLTTDGNRLLGAVTTGRVYFSTVRGTTDNDFLDEEFVPNTVEQKNWIDLDDDGTSITALSKPFQGAIWAFRRDAIARLVPTHQDTAPYRVVWVIRDTYIGPLRQEALVAAIDEAGQPALYWVAQSSIHRYGLAGLQHLSEDVRDYTVGTDYGGAHGVFWDAEATVIFWPCQLVSTPSSVALVFNTKLGRVERAGYVRDGWTVWTGDFASATASVMYTSAAIAGGSANTILVPFVGYYPTLGGTAKILLYGFSVDDDGVDFQAYVQLPHRHYAGMDHACRVMGASVRGPVGSHTLRLTLTADYGAQTARTSDVSMAAAGSETRRRKVFEDAATDDEASAIQIQIGDAAASEQAWRIDELRVHVERGSELRP